MRECGGSGKAATGAMALALLLVSEAAAAQSTPVFSIPTARPTSNPRAQGPVDADNPVVRPTPAPSPEPAPAPVPSPVPTVAPVVRPSPSSTAPPRPTVSRAPITAPTVVPAAATSAAPASDSAPPPSDSPSLPAPGVSATDSFELPPVSDSATAAPGWYWPWLAGAAGLIAALFALLWWRRRRSAPLMLEFEPPVVPAAEPAPAPVAVPLAAPKPRPVAPLPEPKLSLAPQGLGIALEARRMSASLMATTLSYTLTLTNHSAQPLSALAVEGDMISAHASIPPELQMASDGLRLELRHALVTLAPGESAEFTGDLRLPLSSITPIRAGEAAYFVPLARLRVEASTPAGAALVQVQTFVVGELPETAGAGLRPFRLDLGPRVYSQIGQRAVT